jgi:hypothetical protein
MSFFKPKGILFAVYMKSGNVIRFRANDLEYINGKQTGGNLIKEMSWAHVSNKLKLSTIDVDQIEAIVRESE